MYIDFPVDSDYNGDKDLKSFIIQEDGFMKTVIKENANGGKGRVVLKHILDEKELNGKCKMYAEVTIAPGDSLGYHVHHGESETYYIIKGQGEYNDNGTIRQVTVGDKTFTPDGFGHGIANNGDTDLVFMALIIFD